MIRLQNEINKFTNILHIGDIHIRLTQRHQEYLEIFNKLYEQVDKTPESTIVLVAGDIFHNKSDLSPESVKIASNFLKNLADRRPTVLIAGNHDATLANKNRLDSLSPIVNALNHKNLYYLTSSEIYILGDVLFNNYGIFDSTEKYIPFKDIPSIYTNQVNYTIALFHGPVNNAVTDIGYVISSRTIMTEIFDGHQMVMLGDIHRYQVLQEYNSIENKPVIVYCGSLIQQDHGEELKGHGFVYWDLKTKAFSHIELDNDYGFYTVEINKGTLISDISTIPKKAKLRIKCIESVPSEVKSVLNEIKKVSDVTDVTYIKIENNLDTKDIIDANKFNLHNVTDVDYQNTLIKTFLENKRIKVSEDTLKCIYAMNKELNDELKKEYRPKNIRWKPKILEFDNMFSYGEGNIIDFSKMSGNMGLFACNASGKSSILSALSFCLFDKCDRAFKASYILNSQKMSFRCKFNFEINGIDYFIERKGTSDKKGNVKVDVKFWKVENGNEIELNGEARRSTNDIIRDYIGDYEDFILTVLSVQNGKDGTFVDMGQTERKDLLAQFMGLNIFDTLNNLAMDRYREVTILLKNFNSNNYNEEYELLDLTINKLKESIELLSKKIEDLLLNKDHLNENLLECTKRLINVGVENIDISKLEQNKVNIEKDIARDTNLYNNCKIELATYTATLNELVKEHNELVKKDIKTNLNEYSLAKDRCTKLESDIDRKKVIIKNKLEKLSKLESHEYDPNCKFCINNVFVKDAIKTKSELETDKLTVTSLMDTYNSCKSKFASLEWVVAENLKFEQINAKKLFFENKIASLNNVLLKTENMIVQNNTKLSGINDKISLYYQQKESIENNSQVENEINTIKQSIKDIDNLSKLANTQYIEHNSRLQSSLNRKSELEKDIQKIKELESKNDCYKYYLQAVSRDGIPYDLITQVLPVIEKEVNDILHQIVEFTISLKTDGKNIITYIIYDDKKWPLEMASGMERFISSLAIRVALINISNLPRPNFIIFDEGWGSLDSHHLSEIKLLFDYLKVNFDFILIISHIDSIKDLVDNLLEISKINGFSHIKYS